MGPGAFRLLLAFAVFVSHVSRFGIGRPAVALFFLLSGYWVMRLYSGWQAEIWQFCLSRLLRIWPLLAATSLAVVACWFLGLLPRYGSLGSTLALLGLAVRKGDVIGVAWSLDLELQFYLALPMCLWLIGSRRGGAGWTVIHSRRAAALVLVLWSVGIVLLSRGWLTALAFAPTFAAGAAIFQARWRPSPRSAYASLTVFVAAGLLLLALPATTGLLLKSAMPWWYDIAYQCWCFLLLPFVAFNVYQPSGPADRTMGNLAYPFYLVHFPIIMMVIPLLGAGIGKPAALVATLAATALIYVAVDRPVEAWRSRLWRAASLTKLPS